MGFCRSPSHWRLIACAAWTIPHGAGHDHVSPATVIVTGSNCWNPRCCCLVMAGQKHNLHFTLVEWDAWFTHPPSM